MNENRYPGKCLGCGTYVAAGDGYYNGGVYCEVERRSGDRELPAWAEDYDEAVVAYARRAVGYDYWTCSPGWERALRRQCETGETADPVFVPSDEQLARRAERDARRAEQNRAWEAQGLVRCKRCGGAGGSTGWPGYTCFDCGGEGAVLAPTAGPFVDDNADEAELRDLRRRGAVRMDGGWMVPNTVI